MLATQALEKASGENVAKQGNDTVEKKRFINEKLSQDKEKELTLAVKQLKNFIQEEIEILESFMHIEEQNAKMILRVIGIPVF